MTEDDWREHRRKGIGGSDAAAALGQSKWKSQLQLYMEKRGEYEPTIRNPEAVYWGKSLEEPIAVRFQELNPDVEIRRVQAILVHPEHDFMLANIDREIVCPTGNGVLEIKTANAYLADKWEGEDVPIDYVLQVQHYLAVTGYKFAWVCCLIGGQRYVQRYIERDEAIIESLCQGEAAFWRCVQEGTPPVWDGSEASEAFLSVLHPTPEEGKVVALSDELLEVAAKYAELDARYKEYGKLVSGIEKERNACKEILVSALGDAEFGSVGQYRIGYKLVTRKESYSPASSFRRFSFKAA